MVRRITKGSPPLRTAWVGEPDEIWLENYLAVLELTSEPPLFVFDRVDLPKLEQNDVNLVVTNELRDLGARPDQWCQVAFELGSAGMHIAMKHGGSTLEPYGRTFFSLLSSLRRYELERDGQLEMGEGFLAWPNL